MGFDKTGIFKLFNQLIFETDNYFLLTLYHFDDYAFQ